jgi:hypothetical protein
VNQQTQSGYGPRTVKGCTATSRTTRAITEANVRQSHAETNGMTARFDDRLEPKVGQRSMRLRRVAGQFRTENGLPVSEYLSADGRFAFRKRTRRHGVARKEWRVIDLQTFGLFEGWAMRECVEWAEQVSSVMLYTGERRFVVAPLDRDALRLAGKLGHVPDSIMPDTVLYDRATGRWWQHDAVTDTHLIETTLEGCPLPKTLNRTNARDVLDGWDLPVKGLPGLAELVLAGMSE